MGSGVHCFVFLRCSVILVLVLIFDIGGVSSFGEKKEKDTKKLRRIPCSDTISKRQPGAAGPTTVIHIDYCCYRHEAHLEQPLP